MPSVKYLLIGGGLASAEAAKQIRRVDAEGSIALVSDEPLLPYNRPPLSKEYLRGEATEPLEFASAADYEELRVTTVLGSAVTSLDAASSTATLDNGEVYAYEQVLLATGGSPVRLPVPGADLDGVYYLRGASDADAINAAAQEAKRAVVVGAGFIGLETAASLRQMGLDVTVIEMADAIWPRFADRNLAAHVQKLSAARGVEFLVNSPVAGFEGGGGKVSAVLTGGAGPVVACDFAVVGVGIRPNTALAEGAGLAVDNGIVVDEYMRASAPNVFAAGDVANYPDPIFEKRRRVEHWGHAEYSGQVAGANMGGEEMRYDLLTYVWSDIFDLHLEAAGDEGESDTSVVRGDMDAGSFTVLYLKENRMTAYFSVNTPAREFPVFQRLIRRKKDLTGRLDDLRDPGFNARELLK